MDKCNHIHYKVWAELLIRSQVGEGGGVGVGWGGGGGVGEGVGVGGGRGWGWGGGCLVLNLIANIKMELYSSVLDHFDRITFTNMD